jgi:hypothetical protein
MSKRTCDKCGKEKDVNGGKTCEKGHFICKSCVRETAGIFSSERSSCPLCHKKLR